MENKQESLELLEYYQRWLNDGNKSAISAMYDIIQDNIYDKKYSIDSKIAASSIITYNLINQKMETKQTAVEWLIEQLTPAISLQQKHIDEIKEQAKAMEKEQIKDACENGFMWSVEGWNGEMISYYKDGNETLESHKEEYYNETYGN